MDLLTAVRERHAVRRYIGRPIEAEICGKLQEAIDGCNAEGRLHIQLVLNEPAAFGGLMARYGKFSGVQNYVALIGKKRRDTDEKIGYYGEKIALYAQTLGLNTCWVALTYKKVKTAFQTARGEKLYCVLALGYGETQGIRHRQRPMAEVSKSFISPVPDWFARGMESALLAPTAMNQQKFLMTLTADGAVRAKAGRGFYTRIDLGIVKYHFEIGAGKACFQWR